MVWLMFPAYNEKENLKNILPGLQGFLKDKVSDYRILIIDDGSTDSTKNIASELGGSFPIKIISHNINKGIGEVFRTGFSAFNKEAGTGDILIVMEGDGTSDYKLIPDLIAKLKGGSDIVIASRHIKGGAYKGFPFKRYFLSFFGNKVLKVIFPHKEIRDYTIFFRGYKAGIIKEALSLYKERFITSNTFLANTEVLVNMARLTNNISEVPFVYSYGLKIGKSKMPVLKTLADYLKFMATKALPSP